MKYEGMLENFLNCAQSDVLLVGQRPPRERTLSDIIYEAGIEAKENAEYAHRKERNDEEDYQEREAERKANREAEERGNPSTSRPKYYGEGCGYDCPHGYDE